MGSLSAAASLQLPVSLRGIQLGRPTDLLLDAETRQAVGYVVRCGDESQRFLPYAASQTSEREIASALMLLEDVAFYVKRSVSFRSLLGGEVARNGREAGVLRDVRIERGGKIVELELERGGTRRLVPAVGTAVVPTRASAA
jgi:sporulation protein YlmC with PRC-barrel domain